MFDGRCPFLKQWHSTYQRYSTPESHLASRKRWRINLLAWGATTMMSTIGNTRRSSFCRLTVTTSCIMLTSYVGSHFSRLFEQRAFSGWKRAALWQSFPFATVILRFLTKLQQFSPLQTLRFASSICISDLAIFARGIRDVWRGAACIEGEAKDAASERCGSSFFCYDVAIKFQPECPTRGMADVGRLQMWREALHLLGFFSRGASAEYSLK